MPSLALPSTAPRRLLLGATLLAAAITGWVGLGRQGLVTWDEGIYLDEARYIVQAVTALRADADIARATSGFAPRMARPLNVALNVVALSLLGAHPWVPAALAGLCGLLCVYGTYVLGRWVFDERAGLLAAALLTISPYFLQYRRLGLPEAAGTLVALLLMLRLLTLRERDERPWLNSLGLGLLMGAAFTINMRVGALLPVVALFRLAWTREVAGPWRPGAHLMAMLAGLAAVIAVCELAYRLLPLAVAGAPLLESYLQQLSRFAVTQQGMGRPLLPLSYLAPVVFLGYFEAPVALLAVFAVAARPRLWRQSAPALLLACLLAQLLALSLVTPFSRYLSWVLPALMILGAVGLIRVTDRLRPEARAWALAGLLLACLAHAGFRAAPLLRARGAMREAAAWLAGRSAGPVITSDQSIAMAYMDLPLAQLPDEPRAARALLAGSAGPRPAYVLLDRQQLVRGPFVMAPQEHDRSAAALIARGARPLWSARQFEGLFMPFCFEHNRDILQTLRTGRELARASETISLYAAEDAWRALQAQ